MTIIPDSKDWGWVLDRPCPECGFDAGSFPVEGVGPRIRADAARWRAVLSRRDAGVRSQPAVWSAVEYACHVRDVADLFAARLRRMLTEDNPRFANWDQDRVALDEDYASQRAESVSGQVVAALTRLADAFDAVRGAAWERRGVRSDGAGFSVRTLAQYFLHDEVHHVHDVNG